MSGLHETPAPGHAPSHFTRAVLTAGAGMAAACFVVALAAEIVGLEPGSGEMTDVVAVFGGLLALTPWAWATLGVYAVVLTPVVGLLVTAAEYHSVGDRRTVGLAVAVIAVLAVSAAISILQ